MEANLRHRPMPGHPAIPPESQSFAITKTGKTILPGSVVKKSHFRFRYEISMQPLGLRATAPLRLCVTIILVLGPKT